MDPMGSKGAELLYKSQEATREPIYAAREPLGSLCTARELQGG